MGVRAVNIDARKQYMWALEINGFNAAQFMECDFPGVEVEVVEVPQAGALHKIKQPGMLKFEPVTAKRALISTSPDLIGWERIKLAGNPETGVTTPPSALKEDMQLHHLNDAGSPIETFTLHGAWVSKITGEKHQSSSEVQAETMTIQFDYFTRGAA